MALSSIDLTHSERLLRSPYPDGWRLFLTHFEPKRLVVFVHGFRGSPIGTWQHFPLGRPGSVWWKEADMLFVRYDSVKETIASTANLLRQKLPLFYPKVPTELLHLDRYMVRSETGKGYSELYLVGHSLGGVVLRRALSDSAEEWVQNISPHTRRPMLMDGVLRLFSPASAGWRLAGWPGVLESSFLWGLVHPFASKSANYKDLMPKSRVLEDTEAATDRMIARLGVKATALRAHILWASPDEIVIDVRYKTDFVDCFAFGSSHTEVCKPTATFEVPWVFVEEGRI